MTALAPDRFSRPGCFPFEFLGGFLRFLAAHRDRIEVITYDDLPWGDDWDFQGGYKAEFARWQERRDPRKAYVLLQHDADSRPERTMNAVVEEASVGVPSTVMIFAHRVDRRHLQSTGELVYTEYPLDLPTLIRLEAQHGFIVGYHINALEQALWDEARSLEVFASDVEELRRHFAVRYCSAHGGTPGPDGRNNRDVTIPDALRDTIRWVHNGASPFFHGQYSDGGINSPARDPKDRDLRDFIRRFEPGKRYRVLTHPQYYDSPPDRYPRLQGTAWYDELIDRWSSDPMADFWDDVELGF